MLFYLLFFYLLSESMATNSTNDSTSYDMSNKIICLYQGNSGNSDPSSDNLEVKNIPRECDAILYISFSINQSSMINVDEKLLKSVTDLKIPVIVTLGRTEYYSDWSAILGENGNANETKMLYDFAKTHNIQGYDICFLAPGDKFIAWYLYKSDAVDKNVAKNIIAYIKQLKKLCPFLIIGASISVNPKILNNKDVYNFEELNKVLTYFDIEATMLNDCSPKFYNGLTPITKSEPGDNYLYGLEEVVSNLKKTEIYFTKLSISIPLLTAELNNNTYPSYSEMCKGGFDNSSWCVQTSQNYYDKGKYLRGLKVGIRVSGLEWDDYSNTCKCQSALNEFYNINAGYIDGTVISCSKFDVQSAVYPIK